MTTQNGGRETGPTATVEPCAWCDTDTPTDTPHRGVKNLPCCSDRCARMSRPSPMDEQL